jgi:uncharacterized protein YqeY
MDTIDQIRHEMIEALRDKDEVRKGILRVALGEIDTEKARQGKVDEERVLSILRKIIQSNEQTIKFSEQDPKQPNVARLLYRENEILSEFLPKTMTSGEIEDYLRSGHGGSVVIEQVENASSDGAAIGIVMKALKADKKSVLGADVKQAVMKLRGK